ncbi:hypothetical protein Gasu2_05100 [Galdieria sulphuraria]|nr:hypothetical protein Gasu2_05100 [Galdieria sulphuraria]
MKPKLDRFRVSTTVRCQLVLVILDLIKWVSIFFTDVSIFGTAGKENLNQQELWKYSISLVTLLRELSICRRTQILSLCMLPEETIFQEIFKLQSSLVSTGYIAEMVEEFKEKPCSFLSAGCYLFLSLKSSPFEDDCFLDSKCKLDLYLAPIAALFESKWSAHKVMALWLCKETVSNTVIGFRGNQVLRLLQKAKYRCHLSENISVHDSSLLMIFTLLLQYLDKTAYHNRASYEVINTCIHCLPDPFIKWQVVYFCLMMSTTVGIKAQLLHEMKEAMLKMEDDIDATRALVASSTCFEATENQYRLWSWLSDFLFAIFLAPRMSFLEDLPLVSSAIHILAFIIWRLKRQENVAKCKENLECRAKGVRILLSRIVDELYAPSRSPRPDLSFNIPEEMRNRICNESLLCLSLLDQVLLS